MLDDSGEARCRMFAVEVRVRGLARIRPRFLSANNLWAVSVSNLNVANVNFCGLVARVQQLAVPAPQGRP